MNDKNILMEDLVSRLEDKREIKNLMGKYAASLIIRRDRFIFDDFWAQDQSDVSLGLNDGYYVGPASVRSYYAAVEQKIKISSEILRELFPDQLGRMSDDKLYGVGTLEMKPLQSPYIQVAKDHKTAKGIWAVNGNSAEITASGPTARWSWGFFAADFIMEKNEWKIWHLLYLEDINVQAGNDWSEPVNDWPERPEFEPLKSWHLPEKDVKCDIRSYYSPDRPFTPTPPVPAEYETFSKTFSYGPQDTGSCISMHEVSDSICAFLNEDHAGDEDAALLCRVLARDMAVDIMNLRVYLNANEQRQRELDELWVSDSEHRKTASFGKNWGYYTGMDSIEKYYIGRHDELRRQSLENYCAAHPQTPDSDDNLGIACASLFPISAPSVQVAQDGKTIKALFYSVGYENIPMADGTIRARWIAQKVAADFILEDDGYKIWHLLEISDSEWRPGVNYHDEMPVFEQEDDILRVEFGDPDIAVMTHDRQFCWADNYPAMPVPYDTFTDELSWGSEGFRPFTPSVRAREIILAPPTQPTGLSTAGARTQEGEEA